MGRRIKNTGSIFYRTNRDIWVFQIPLHLATSKKTISAKTKKELAKKIEEFYKEVEENKLKQENKTIVELLHDFENDKLKKNLITPISHSRNLATISKLEEDYIGKIPIHQITVKDLNNFANTLVKYSNSVIEKIFIQLKREVCQMGILKLYEEIEKLEEKKKEINKEIRKLNKALKEEYNRRKGE